jgi:signal transduction histidine kinase
MLIQIPKEARIFGLTLNFENQAKFLELHIAICARANLVTNAVQAMPNGGNLTIDAHKEEDNTILSVKDTGVGIPQEIRDKMFTLMFTTKAKGQGFGLPVVKRMAESLGGTVTFESQEGKGTTFIVRLPPPKELNGKWTYK